MGLFDNLQEAAQKVAPVAKDIAEEAGRTVKAVGETIAEDKPVQKAATGAGKAIIAAGNSIAKNRKGKRIEKESEIVAELKARYQGGIDVA